MTQIDCEEAARRLHGFLDKELSEAEIVEVQAHLNTCEECESKFRFEASLKRVVMRRSSEQQAPASLRNKIADRLRRGK